MGGRVAQVIESIIPIIESVAIELGVDNPLSGPHLGGLLDGVNRQCLHTT
jgi:glucan endo-1,6-beta-glucosidase